MNDEHMKQCYGYLVIDCTPQYPSEIKVCADIFPRQLTSSDSVIMDNKNKNKNKKQYRTKNKIKNECTFLYFIANNKDEKQTKQVLHYFTNPIQYTLLRELVVNDLAENIPDYNLKKI